VNQLQEERFKKYFSFFKKKDAKDYLLEHTLNAYMQDQWWGSHIINLWYDVCVYGKDLDYKQRRRLFIDLVRYFMQKGLMKFRSGEVEVLDKEKEEHKSQADKQYEWKKISEDFENFTPEEMVEFLEKYMPTGDEEGFDDDLWVQDFFYISMPPALYRYDGSDPEFPEPEWIEAS
jgi:hypothetical protein